MGFGAPAQVPSVVREARAALEAGQAVVIGLQSTGEAAADALGLEPGQACGFVSTTRELLSRFVTNHFPTMYEANTAEGECAPDSHCSLQMRLAGAAAGQQCMSEQMLPGSMDRSDRSTSLHLQAQMYSC